MNIQSYRDLQGRLDKMNAPLEFDFDYYGHVNHTVHSFIVGAVEGVCKKIGDPSFKHVAILNRGLTSLQTFANEQKAELIDFKTPVPNMAYVNEDSDYGKSEGVRERFADRVFKFKIDKAVVYVTNLIHLHQEYDEIYSCNTSAVIAQTKEDAHAFVIAYQRAKWKRNRRSPCVLNYTGERMENFRKANWSDIYLPNDMTEEIKDEIETFFANKDAYAAHNLDWKRGLMLAGRPGNGKTLLARAIATNSTVPVIYCTLDDDDMFRILDRVGRTIRQNAPCIVIFEDADTLASNPQLRSAMLNMLDGLFTACGVLTIASTNSPEKLDEAFTGRPSRFDSFYVIEDPHLPERRKILLTRLGKFGSKLPKKQLGDLLKQMSGLSAACVQEVAVCALLASLKSKKPVNMTMLKASLDKMKKHLRSSEEGIDKTARGAIGFEPDSADDF